MSLEIRTLRAEDITSDATPLLNRKSKTNCNVAKRKEVCHG